MLGSCLAGCGTLLLAMVPAIIVVVVSLRVRDAAERGKRIIAFVSLALNLMAILGFLSFLYVRPAFLNLGLLHALPFLTRFTFNPWILHSFVIVSLLIIGFLHWIFRKHIRDKHGFSVVTIAIMLISLCMWVLGSTFHYGLSGRLLVGSGLSTKMLVPLHSLIIFFIFFVALTWLYAQHIRRGRSLWLCSIFLLFCGLVSYHFFAWYLPTFALAR